MRIALAELAQETDSFTPLVADLRDFDAYGLYFGAEILQRMRGVGPLGGFLEVAARQPAPVELLPLLRAWGSAGGTIAARALTYLTERLLSGLKEALPVDAVFLSLHGAASAENEDDVEGHVLEAVRGIVGAGVPVAVALDHHANITSRMVKYADILIGHETQPHDPPATGRKAARILFRMLHGDVRPTAAWQKIPLITPQDQFLTASGPMREWFDLARSFETRPRVLDVSPYPMQPWLDAAEGGWSVVVHTDNDPGLAAELARKMANLAWRLREQFWVSERVTPAEAIQQADAAEAGLIILSDTGDSVYGGAPGDSTCLLQSLLDRPPAGLAYVPLVDRAAVEAAIAAGVGASVSLEVGACFDQAFSRPVRVTGEVAATSQGVMVNLHDRGVCDLRRTALLAIGPIRLVLLDHRSFAINHPVLYTHLGLELADAKMVIVKTASNFQFFSRWRRGLIRVDSPGATQSNLKAFHWQRLPRPTFPLDPLDDWRAP
jgi:microcystin degradation protein MlrC